MELLGTRFPILRILIVLFVTLLLLGSTFLALRQPSHDRSWNESQSVLPYAEINGSTITIYNIRNTEYKSRRDFTTTYYDKTFSLDDVRSVDYIIEPFASVAAAHTFLSFGLADGSQIAISVEARREADERFTPFLGAFRQYELMYTIVDERDALGLRAIHRDNPILLYPTTASPEAAQALLLSMLERTNEIQETPEFYNVFTNSCATNIADHINELSPGKIDWDYRLVLPKESDALAYEAGLLGTETSLEELRQTHDVTAAIKEHIEAEKFSAAIRTHHTTSD